MATEQDYYTSPGSEIEPGDVFLDIPFPALKHPLTLFRINVKEDSKTAFVFSLEETSVHSGDSPRCSLELRTVMLLSHGCEVERVTRGEDPTKRHWLAAPILPLSACKEEMRTRVREGRQPNRFYLPGGSFNSGEEMQVDLRKITPINCQYFLEAEEASKRVTSLTGTARLELHSQLGVFFSGLALYIQAIPCPECGALIDPSQFRIDSDYEADTE